MCNLIIVRKLFFSLLLGFIAIVSDYGQNPVDSARYLFVEARLANDAGDFQRSGTLLKQIIDRKYPLSEHNQALVRIALGYSYYETGRLTESLDQYRMAESLATGNDQNSLQLRISININHSKFIITLMIFLAEIGPFCVKYSR